MTGGDVCFSMLPHLCRPPSHARSQEIEDAQLLLIVGAVGLGINLIGLLVLSQDGHGHSHGGGGGGGSDHGHGHGHGHEDRDGGAGHGHGHGHGHGRSLNMHGVWLHVMGDALGSVAVIISAVVIKYTDWDGRFYLDPALSLVIVAILVYTTVPLLRESALIMLQRVPNHINMSELKQGLKKVNGVLDIHELHIWQLADKKIIASVHVVCDNAVDYMTVGSEIKAFFHEQGIHSLTVQQEFFREESLSGESLDDGLGCQLSCPEPDCAPHSCCGTSTSATTTLRARHSTANTNSQLSLTNGYAGGAEQQGVPPSSRFRVTDM